MVGSACIACAVAVICLLWTVLAEAQFYYFGKNKVQYAHFDWLEMQTENFDIYFYESEIELAGFAAQMAEEGYLELERRLGHTVQRRIPLIIYSSNNYFEQTNIIPDLLPEGVAGFTAPKTVRVSANRPAKGDALHLHFVNYNRTEPAQAKSAGGGIHDEKPIAVKGIRCDVPVPKGKSLDQVRFLSPELEEEIIIAAHADAGDGKLFIGAKDAGGDEVDRDRRGRARRAAGRGSTARRR